MSFGRHVPPELLADFIARQREVHARRLTEYEAHAASNEEGRDVFRDANLAFGLAYERAVLAWFDSLPPDLRRAEEPNGGPG
jgi:hypothetical protein